MTAESVRAWRPPVPGVSEVFHARFVDHAYPPHTHDTWTVFIVDAGGVGYDLDRHHHDVARPMVSVLPPHVVHDGRPADGRGYRKRVLYLDTRVLGEELVGRAVDAPVIEDARLRRGVARLHELLECRDDAGEAEAALAFVAERIRARLLGRPDEPPADRSALAERLRALLDAEPLTLAAAGERLAASPAHLVRSFTATFGIPPHAYVLGRRIEAARGLLLEGTPAARVAADVGFYDQAHFTRHFKRHVGTTPGDYAAAAA